MMKKSPTQKYLFWLVGINILTTILHYGHNVIHFEHYPEPVWLNSTLVDMFWFVMTPFVLFGSYLYHRLHYRAGLVVMMTYVLMSLLVLGHYNYAPFFDIALSIHLFIWLEVVAAILLAVYCIWLSWDKINPVVITSKPIR